MPYSMTEMQKSDLKELKSFTDRAIGEGYYSVAELENIWSQSQGQDHNGQIRGCSFLLRDNGQILGMRFTYPPGNWEKGKGSGANKGLTQNKWPFDIQQTAYFQSLFLDSSIQGKGWGAKLSLKSIEALKQVGAKGVVCHSWKESPNNSSSRYLEKLGFKVIAEHPLYWKDIDYNCTRCGSPPCQCTAVEMYLRLDAQ